MNIHSDRYQTYGTSKAKKMRAFWEREPDALVARVLSEMLDSYEADCDLNGRERDAGLLEKSRAIVAKLSGKAPIEKADAVKSFLHKEFEIPNIQRLPVELPVAEIIEGRLNEARAALSVDAYLSVIFLCGSVLEGVLLGAAQREPAKFNLSPTSPKRSDGKVKPFQAWTLAQFIDVACDINVLKPDVKELSPILTSTPLAFFDSRDRTAGTPSVASPTPPVVTSAQISQREKPHNSVPNPLAPKKAATRTAT